MSREESNSILSQQKTIALAAPFAVTTSFSDGHNSVETSSAIFSSGKKLMALYTKWKATKPVLVQSSAFKAGNASSSFDSAKSNLAADGSSHEHQKLEGKQEHNVHLLNLDDSTAVTSSPFPKYLTFGGHIFSTLAQGTSNYKN